MTIKEVMRGAYDLHVHASPDVVRRSQNLAELSKSVLQAGMEGIVIKDHTASTVGRCFVLNQTHRGRIHFFSTLALNPPVGGINPIAVEAALRAGVDIVFFPTYGAKNHITRWGLGKPPTAFPVPHHDFEGIAIVDKGQKLLKECDIILEMLAKFDAVLATGHISPEESLELLNRAVRHGVRRMVVTHASEPVVAMTPEQQREAVKMGGLIEHCFFAVTISCPNPVPLEMIYEQIREVGVANVILSSDFGQTSNPSPVEGFAFYLEKIGKLGFSDEELKIMTRDNPRRLVSGRVTLPTP